jgi:hypothetical protein
MSTQFNADKRWDITWKYGHAGEEIVAALCDLTDDGEVHIEVKRKSRNDWKFYIELEHDPGRSRRYKPSGLSVTEAPIYAVAIGAAGIVVYIRTEFLKEAIRRNYGQPAAEHHGSCPTRGRLLDFFDILNASMPGPASRAQFGDHRWPA